MTIETKYIHNVATDEVIIEPLTQKEIETRAVEYAVELAELQAKKAKEEELRLLKISAYKKLGLTNEEIEALVPTPLEDNA